MTPEKLEIWAAILGIAGISNWIFGGISWRGRVLNLRNKNPWVALRWTGIGLLVGFAVIGTGDGITREIVGIVGSILVIFGSARAREPRAAKDTKANKPAMDKPDPAAS